MVSIPNADDGVIDANDIAGGLDMMVALPESTEAGDQVIVTVADSDNKTTEVITSVPADWDGTRPLNVNIPAEALGADGTTSVVIKDQAGNESIPSDSLIIELDTVIEPSAPLVQIVEATDGSGC